ncbi:MAG: hypothetical protein IKV03_01880 [Alphaproteobacteria bacterium]|nr:hypothetical protein [Alphaproteobacteria bacterium]
MRFIITFLLLIASTCVMAERVSFVEASQDLLNNEIIASPIYTKKLYRQMYEEDKAAYEQRINDLNTMRKDGKISEKNYLHQTETLIKTFKKAYPQTLSQQGQVIEQDAVTMWNIATFSNHRRLLFHLTHPEYRQVIKDTLSGANLPTSNKKEDNKNSVKTNTVSSKPEMDATQKLGRKSFSINTDAFK